jgi:threonine/homoserine/homoserine lactone efflux protein
VISGSHFAQFLVASVLIILAPGPSVLFTLARGVAWGRSVAVLTVLGINVGALLLSLVVAFGLGPLLSHSKPLSIALQVIGGFYLLWLGLDALRHRAAHAQAMTQREEFRPSRLQIIRQGFTVGVLNPKTLIFFAAVFPHFVDRSKGNVTLQLVVFGCVFCVIAFVCDSTWGVIAGTAREWLTESPRRLVVLRSTGGAVMCALGVLILVSALISA